ncbi:hypothetical protein PIB30_071741 [Stylosanthes scabra]|uniref:Uncharacterized protein n=1 Tax=Stylosanthes scabra TaxID=79078 RepID=A0ABU6YLF1_9FABA|nr:hypothetical protein [Stylosanthes scabra]
MSGRGGGTSRGRGRGRGGGRGQGGGRITVSTTPTNDPVSGSETAPPPPISAPASSAAPPPPPPSAEHSQPDATSAPDTSEASRIVTDADGRIRLRLDGKNGFLPSNASTQEMSDVVKLMYNTPWLSYSKVPIEVKNRWFDKWMENFYFEEPVNPILVRKTFDYRMGLILQQMLRKV